MLSPRLSRISPQPHTFPPMLPFPTHRPLQPGGCRRSRGRAGGPAQSREQSTPQFRQEKGIPFRAERVSWSLSVCSAPASAIPRSPHPHQP